MMIAKRFLLLLGLLLTGCARPSQAAPAIKTKIVIGETRPAGTPLPRLTGRSPLDSPRSVSLETEPIFMGCLPWRYR